MTTSFGVRSTLRSAAARRIEAAGLAFQQTHDQSAESETQLDEPARPQIDRSASVPGQGVSVRSLFKAPIETTRPAAARRDAGKGKCRTIIEEVAAKYGVAVREILSDRRARVLIPPRHEAMFRCVAETHLSLPAIGRVFNRDHTSIGHAVMRHHINTGEPLPRGMDWKAGRRKRR